MQSAIYKLLFALLLLCAVAAVLSRAQATPEVPEVLRLRIVVSYQKALLAQMQEQQFHAVEKQTHDEFNAAMAAAAKELKLPEGTTFNVDVASGQVVPVLPGGARPSAAAPAPAPVPAQKPEVKK